MGNPGRPTSVATVMRLDIWSDLVCPYCSIGNAELERALADFEHRDDVEIRWRSFELDPDAPVDPQTDVVTKIAEKYGMSTEQSRAAQEKIGERSAELGLPYDWAAARWGNTFDAHRVAHLADDRGVGHDVSGRLLRAYFSEGRQPRTPTRVRCATMNGWPGSWGSPACPRSSWPNASAWSAPRALTSCWMPSVRPGPPPTRSRGPRHDLGG